jgi:hypothetical protein
MRKKDNETIEGERPGLREGKPNATAAAGISLNSNINGGSSGNPKGMPF